MMQYLSCTGEAREFAALAAVPADAGASASVLLLSPVIRMSDAGKVAVELRFGNIVLHHLEWELAAGAAFHLPGKWVLNAGYSLYFASYAAGASLEACAVIEGDFNAGNGTSGGYLEILIPNGAWYIEERIRWKLGCRAVYSLDENEMPDVVTYSGKVAVPSQVFRTARQNTSGATITSASPVVPLAFGYPAGEAQETVISEGPFSTQASALALIASDYNAVPAKYQLSLSSDSDIRSTWTNEDTSIDKYPESKLVTGQYGPGASTTPGTPNIVSDVWPVRDISDDVEAFPDENITWYNFAGTIYEEVYP